MEHSRKYNLCAFAPLRALRETHSCHFVSSRLCGKTIREFVVILFQPPKKLFFSKKLPYIALEMIDKINPDLIASM